MKRFFLQLYMILTTIGFFLINNFFNLKEGYIFYLINNSTIQIAKIQTKNSKETNTSTNYSSNSHDKNCKAIEKVNKQYRVKIDDFDYPQYVPIYFNQSLNFKCLNSLNDTKTILLWNNFFENPDYGYGLGEKQPFVKNNCPVTNCELTTNKSRIIEADLVVVHMRNEFIKQLNTISLFQRWVFLLYESPVHSGDFTSYNNIFNYTATYRIQSDFANLYEFYANFVWKLNQTFNENYDFYSLKSKFAAAVISNCEASSKRMEYIKQMQSYISVEIFGGCGKKCPDKFSDDRKGQCKEIIGNEYKFYLSFENRFGRFLMLVDL